MTFRCENCGMDHYYGENKLCTGPYITLDNHRKELKKLADQFYAMRNQYYFRMGALNLKVPDEDLIEIIRCQADVERLTK